MKRILLALVCLALPSVAQPPPAVSSGQVITAAYMNTIRNELISIRNDMVTAGIPSGANLPGTCNVGQLYFKTSATTGLYQCTASNTWSSGGSGSSIATPVSVANGGTGLSASVEDALLVGSSTTTWQTKVLPSCSNATLSKLLYDNSTNTFTCGVDQSSGSGGGAPTTATYITQTADAGLSAEQALSSLATGPVKVTTGTGVLTSGAIGLTTEVSGVLPIANGGTNLTAAADDNIPVGNGTTWQSKAIPSCSNTTTSKLLYDNSTNAFSCGTDQNSGGGGGGASIQTDLQDIKVTNTSTVITIPAGLRPAVGYSICSDGTSSTVTVVSGTAHVYISVRPDCSYEATTTATLGSASGITIASGSAVPPNNFPLADCNVTSGSISACVDTRRAFRFQPILAGAGITLSNAATGLTISSTGSGGGSSVTKVPMTYSYPTAAVNNTTATLSPFWLLAAPSGSNPDPIFFSGSWAGLEYQNGDTTDSAFLTVAVPTGWDGGTVDLRIHAAIGAVASAVATFSIFSYCIGDGQLDASASLAGPQNTTKTIGDGSNAQTVIFTLSSVTMTGCAAGKELRIALLRTADAFTGSIIVKSVDLTYRLNLE